MISMITLNLICKYVCFNADFLNIREDVNGRLRSLRVNILADQRLTIEAEITSMPAHLVMTSNTDF